MASVTWTSDALFLLVQEFNVNRVHRMKPWYSVKWKVTEWHSCTMRSPFQTIQLALTWLRGRSLSCGFPFYALTRTSKMKINQDYVHFKYTLQTQLYGYAISNPLTTSKYNRVSMIFFFWHIDTSEVFVFSKCRPTMQFQT